MYKTQDTTIYIQAVGGNGAQSNQETRTRRSKRVSLGDGKRKMTKAWEWRNCRLEFDLVESSRVYLILPPFDTKKTGSTRVACFLRKQLKLKQTAWAPHKIWALKVTIHHPIGSISHTSICYLSQDSYRFARGIFLLGAPPPPWSPSNISELWGGIVICALSK